MMHPPLKLKEAITSRVKIMARLDIAEKRLPQDGRIKIKTKIAGKVKDLDFRVSVLPTLFGEKIVMRLLDKDKLMLDMTQAGLRGRSRCASSSTAILKPYGMVLVTGPTGSGKTNTLYSALQRINTPEVNIMTAEDPVEFNLLGRSTRSRRASRSASTSRRRCAPSCARTRTSSWSARSATSRPPRWRSRPP